METKEFFCYAWHIDKECTDYTTIRIYGLDQNNKNVCVRVENFTPYIFIELPAKFPTQYNAQQEIKWDSIKVDRVMQALNHKLRDKPLNCAFKMKESLYYANLDFVLR